MPVKVFRIPDEPILIATFTGPVTVAHMREMYEASAALIAPDENCAIYRITDFRSINSTPQEALRIYQTARLDMPASTTDPRVRPILLGSNKWTRLASEMMWDSERLNLPIFESLSDALTHIRILQHPASGFYSGASAS